jgi:hypothetical protein
LCAYAVPRRVVVLTLLLDGSSILSMLVALYRLSQDDSTVLPPMYSQGIHWILQECKRQDPAGCGAKLEAWGVLK